MMGINRTPMAHSERIQPLEQFWREAYVYEFHELPALPQANRCLQLWRRAANGKRDARAFSGGAAARPWRCASEALPASLWRCEPFLELSRNTVARTNEEAGKSGPTFEVSQ